MNAIAAGRPPASSTVTVVDDSSGPDDPTTDIVTVVVVVLTHFTELCLVVCVIVFDSVVFVSVSGYVAMEETITVAVAKAWLSAPAGMEDGARLGASDGLSLGAADGTEDGRNARGSGRHPKRSRRWRLTWRFALEIHYIRSS
jgi:hypothetical protein